MRTGSDHFFLVTSILAELRMMLCVKLFHFHPYSYRMRPKLAGLFHEPTSSSLGCLLVAAIRQPSFRVPHDTKIPGHSARNVPEPGTPEGTRYTIELAPSSRRQANVHRTLASHCSNPKKAIIRTCLSPRTGSDYPSLVRQKGLEPPTY